MNSRHFEVGWSNDINELEYLHCTKSMGMVMLMISIGYKDKRREAHGSRAAEGGKKQGGHTPVRGREGGLVPHPRNFMRFSIVVYGDQVLLSLFSYVWLPYFASAEFSWFHDHCDVFGKNFESSGCFACLLGSQDAITNPPNRI